MRFSLLFISITLLALCVRCSHNQETPATVEHPSFVNIAPILYKNCTPCHRPGESGPFSLLTYSDAKKNAKKIKFVTQSRYMPPWPADVNYTHFIGERRLSDEDIAMIKSWVDGGCEQGDVSKTPQAPTYYTGSFFGKPDTVIRMARAVPIRGNGTDHFYLIKMPMELAHDTFVRYFEFVPDKRKLAHHINGHLVNYVDSKKKNVHDGIPYTLDEYKDYKEVFQKMGVLHDDGSFPTLTPNTVYYLPGYAPPLYPDGIGGYRMNKKSAILMKSIHYGPSPVDVTDSSVVNVFFGPKPKRLIQETQLGTFGVSKIEPELILQPNQIQTFHTQATLNTDISVLSVNPHMHLLGKSFLAYAITPQQDTIRLVRIPKWDFRWQYYYTFEHPVKIPAGSTVYAFATFDNTDKNPFNPFHPPRVVTQGEGVRSMQTTEEMFQFIFSYLPYQKGDELMDLSGNAAKHP
ncbi:MAG: hypothetical protein JST26_09860 [Bacteroidetes bacterium]|nr:hypothetical protein [Bacteroidota bacterium]